MEQAPSHWLLCSTKSKAKADTDGLRPSIGPGKDRLGYFLYRSTIGIDAQVADCGALQGLSGRCRLVGDLLEDRSGLSV